MGRSARLAYSYVHYLPINGKLIDKDEPFPTFHHRKARSDTRIDDGIECAKDQQLNANWRQRFLYVHQEPFSYEAGLVHFGSFDCFVVVSDCLGLVSGMILTFL